MDSLCLQQNKYGCQAPYTYIQGMHKYIILVCTSCAIFHVVYSSNISRLFPSMHFPISARATLMEEPSHQRCNDRVERDKRKVQNWTGKTKERRGHHS
jgi:hypothetical protein